MTRRKSISHPRPVWGDRADHMLTASLEPDAEGVEYEEQLWCRKQGDNLYRVCCIPFFAYGFNLGDIVRGGEGDRKYVIEALHEAHGHHTFRVRLTEESDWKTIVALNLIHTSDGYLWEDYSQTMIAIDAHDSERACKLEGLLNCDAEGGRLVFEKA